MQIYRQFQEVKHLYKDCISTNNGDMSSKQAVLRNEYLTH